MDKITLIIGLLLFMSWSGFAQDMRKVFLDSIDVNELIGIAQSVDTLIADNHYAIRIDYSDEITIFGNVDKKQRPDGKWLFTFRSDRYEFVSGSYDRGKRDGPWFIACGARKYYKKGKPKLSYRCPF